MNDSLIQLCDDIEGLGIPSLDMALVAREILGEGVARQLRELQQQISNAAETLENKLGYIK